MTDFFFLVLGLTFEKLLDSLELVYLEQSESTEVYEKQITEKVGSIGSSSPKSRSNFTFDSVRKASDAFLCQISREQRDFKAGWVELAAEIVTQAYDSIQWGEEESEKRSRYTWQIAKCYQLGWSEESISSHLRQKFQQQTIFWIVETLKLNPAYAQYKYANSGRLQEIDAVLAGRRDIIEWLQARRDGLEERTPLPRRAENEVAIWPLDSYDPDYKFSHLYHAEAAVSYVEHARRVQRFAGKLSYYQKAIVAWRNALNIRQRTKYWKELIDCLRECEKICGDAECRRACRQEADNEEQWRQIALGRRGAIS